MLRDMAAKMLGTTDCRILHYEFLVYLDEISRYVGVLGGRIASRQVVALAIVTWQRMNPDKEICNG